MGTSKSGHDWSSPGVSLGIREVCCTSWSGFIDFCTSAMLGLPRYVYRGQSEASWPLMPSLQRLLIGKTLAGSPDKDLNVINRHLKRFKYATRGRLSIDRKALTEDEWWALGQHHGLATPLLDWSESPYVAAFFAFSDPESATHTSEFVVVYGLGRSSVKRFNAGIDDRLQRLNFIEPERDDNPRLVSQRGLFTKLLSIQSVEDWVQQYAPASQKRGTLLKILIPRSEATKALLSLNRMNINHSSLFPDLYGACNHSNMSLAIENYD